MWWNRSKTPSGSENGEIRELQLRVAAIETDFEKVFNLIAKINGRLRQRDRRADSQSDRDDSDGGDNTGDRMPDFVAPIQSSASTSGAEQSSSLMPPVLSKEQLRQLARSRGLLRS